MGLWVNFIVFFVLSCTFYIAYFLNLQCKIKQQILSREQSPTLSQLTDCISLGVLYWGHKNGMGRVAVPVPCLQQASTKTGIYNSLSTFFPVPKANGPGQTPNLKGLWQQGSPEREAAGARPARCLSSSRRVMFMSNCLPTVQPADMCFLGGKLSTQIHHPENI